MSDCRRRRDAPYFRIYGKRGKIQYVEVYPEASELIHDYLEAIEPVQQRGPLFCPIKNARGDLNRHLTTDGIYKNYALSIGIDPEHFSPHALRATAITNALEHQADIAKVQD